MDKPDIDLKDCLELFPLRIAVTDYCNLKCFFCSNEGMKLLQKNTEHININELKYLIKLLAENGLKNISITGGDPAIYPDILELLSFFEQFSFNDIFFHTNGVGLNKDLLDVLYGTCNKVAVSIHTANFRTWNRVTNGNKEQFKQLMRNIELLSELTDKILVELKFVSIKGYNDSEKEFKDFIDLCSKFGFKFKFLNFEPIIPSHIGLSVNFDDIIEKLINIGCKLREGDKEFRGQSNYLPIKRFVYKDICGVAIEIGCGEKDVCKECYQSNEIFITSTLTIKPCHMNSHEISLKEFIKDRNEKAICDSIIESRLFLSKSPGLGLNIWQNN